MSSCIGPKASEPMVGTIPTQITVFVPITEQAIDAALRAGINSATFARLGETHCYPHLQKEFARQPSFCDRCRSCSTPRAVAPEGGHAFPLLHLVQAVGIQDHGLRAPPT